MWLWLWLIPSLRVIRGNKKGTQSQEV
jgi:hypothetical protein